MDTNTPAAPLSPSRIGFSEIVLLAGLAILALVAVLFVIPALEKQQRSVIANCRGTLVDVPPHLVSRWPNFIKTVRCDPASPATGKPAAGKPAPGKSGQ